MFKLVLSVVLVVCFAAAGMATDSPVDKGSKVLYGTSFFAYQSGDLYENSDGDGQLNITANLGLGYFVSPGFEIGGEFALITLKQGDASLTTTLFGPAVAYYFNAEKERAQIKGAWYPYVRAFYQYVNISSGGASASASSFGAMFGVVHMLSNAVAEDIGIKFQKDEIEGVSGTTIWFGAGIKAFIW